jgi:hypothetical protein
MIKYIFAAACTLIPNAAYAEIKAQGENGFNVVQIATVDAEPNVIWKRLIAPKEYWNKSHSWSGSVDGFYIDAQAGGCFCEVIQEKQPNGKLKNIGSVEHMRVIFAHPGKVLRMQGALGPLQSEAVLGTLTVAIEPAKDKPGTLVSFSYVVGGYMRYKVRDIAPSVDKVIGEQFASLLSPYAKLNEVEVRSEEEKKDEEWSLDLKGLNEDTAVKPGPAAKIKKKSPAAAPSKKPISKPPAKPVVAKKPPAKPDPKKER